MLKLYTREACPFSAKVRAFLEAHTIPYEAVPVPKLGSERGELLALEGIESAEVPALVDGDTIIQGSDAILAHLKERTDLSYFGDPAYGLTRTFRGASYSDLIEAVKVALGSQGFGVLTEVDVRATFKAKLGEDFRNYVILGTCNPKLAFKALAGEPAVGLLLPCNVVVTEEDDGSAVVSAIDPVRMLTVSDRGDMGEFAVQVRTLLKTALANIAI